MNVASQSKILALIVNLNEFADQAENLINKTTQAYKEEKQRKINRYEGDQARLRAEYNSNCALAKSTSEQMVASAQTILFQIDKMDQKLSAVDKYYVKTKMQKEKILQNVTSEKYQGITDYFTALDEIEKSFKELSRKYAETILPALINGINFLFSSQRKKDYMELIVLKNTVDSFVTLVKNELPLLLEDNLEELKETYFTNRGVLRERYEKELREFEQTHTNTLDDVADEVYNRLDKLLPDTLVNSFAAITASYQKTLSKVNAANNVANSTLHVMWMEYEIGYYVQSNVVGALIQEKCEQLMTKDVIQFPVVMSTKDAPPLIIVGDNSSVSAMKSFVHAIMFGLIAACAVSKLCFTVIDPENRGNSIAPFFDARKKMPELFHQKMHTSKEDIAEQLRVINENIEDMVQNKLGNNFESIFDYANATPNYEATVQCLLLFDFPQGLDESSLADLRNILRNGSRCGIYTVISHQSKPDQNYSTEYGKSLQVVFELCNTIHQTGEGFAHRGLPLQYLPMPEKNNFADYFNKYVLFYERIQNRGIAFSPIVKALMEAQTIEQTEATMQYICNILMENEKNTEMEPHTTFPAQVTLGTVLYPADVFSNSVAYDAIVKKFGIAHTGRQLVEMPFSFDFQNPFHLFVQSADDASGAIARFTHHMIWRFLSAMPVTKVNVCVFDNEQRGNSIVLFLDFRKRSPDIFDQKIHTGQDAICQRLEKLNIQIDEFIQEKLGNRYKDIFEYNKHTPRRAEAITLLMLYDFPSGFDSRNVDLLINILRNGAKCGIYTILSYNPNISVSRYESIDEKIEIIKKYCAIIDCTGGKQQMLPYNLPIVLPEQPDMRVANAFVEEYGKQCALAQKKGLSFEDIVSEHLFDATSAKGLRIPIGVGDGDAVVSVVIGEGSSHHGLIAGATGSGKSTLLHTLIMSSMLHYSPDELQLYLMDFKSGTEFKIYESVKIPHVKLLALDAMQEFGESILENLVREMEQRSRLLKDVGQTSLSGYAKTAGKPLPRIMVIMDEFQVLFNDATNRKIAMHCAELTKRIVTEGRAFGIHLIMATQSTKVIAELTLSPGTLEQMRIRMGLKCGESDARYLFSDENSDKALQMMKGELGTAVMNLDYTEQSNIGLRVAYCDDDTQKRYLDQIAQTFATNSATTQVFEGNRTIKLLDYFADAHITKTDAHTVSVHMGTLIKVAPPFAVSVDRKKKHNLLVCGSNERMANNVVNNYIISALLHENASVYCVDGDALIGEDTCAKFYDTTAQYYDNFKIADCAGDVITYVNEVYQKYLARKKKKSEEVVFVVIRNLQYIDLVQSMMKGEMIDESEFIDAVEQESNPLEITFENPFASIDSMFSNNTDQKSIAEKFNRLVVDGAGYGIHFVVSSLEYQTVKECMYYGENILSRFPERIIFSLSENDADSLIENVSVAGLNENTVYFTDSIKNTFQLKPYITPDDTELQNFYQGLMES